MNPNSVSGSVNDIYRVNPKISQKDLVHSNTKAEVQFQIPTIESLQTMAEGSSFHQNQSRIFGKNSPGSIFKKKPSNLIGVSTIKRL